MNPPQNSQRLRVRAAFLQQFVQHRDSSVAVARQLPAIERQRPLLSDDHVVLEVVGESVAESDHEIPSAHIAIGKHEVDEHARLGRLQVAQALLHLKQRGRPLRVRGSAARFRQLQAELVFVLHAVLKRFRDLVGQIDAGEIGDQLKQRTVLDGWSLHDRQQAGGNGRLERGGRFRG